MQLLVNHMREKWSSSVGFILASIGSAGKEVEAKALGLQNDAKSKLL